VCEALPCCRSHVLPRLMSTDCPYIGHRFPTLESDFTAVYKIINSLILMKAFARLGFADSLS